MLITLALALLQLAPLDHALAFLAREVPAWARDNHCYSCHNNGDAARALSAAHKRGRNVPPEALRDTATWLVSPKNWDEGAKHPAASDLQLARIQFTATLAAAVESGTVTDRAPLREAARRLAQDQHPDGSWRVETHGLAGSPITWGTALATALARRSLQTASAAEFATAIGRAEKWLRTDTPRNLLDTSAVLLAFPADPDIRARSVAALLKAQTSGGGWGPQPHAPAEPFDTAVALLALQALDPAHRPASAIARGRAFLLKTQLDTGAWPETTRPSGARSYAHHVSTTAWAALALLALDNK